MSQQAKPVSHQSPPWWRDVRVLAILGQVVFVLVVALLLGILVMNVMTSMQRLGMSGSYAFMNGTAGFEIAQKLIPYQPADSYWRAFQVGVANTIIIAVLGIFLATIVGIVMGVTQLSSNWLLAKLAQGYVTIFRNIPLLLQLLFWYSGVFLVQLPNVRNAIGLPNIFYLSNRGVAFVGPEFTATAFAWLGFILAGVLVSVGVSLWLRRIRERTGRQYPLPLINLGIILGCALLGWLLLSPTPFIITVPALERFNIQGGVQLAPEMAALLLGLVIYTGAFIAENVRAGIQGVSKGQKEAARALGLSAGQSMRLVILPQALRIIIPPTTNQYLNLVKNSSLAIAIGYPDLFNVTRTIFNQTGQTVQIIGLIMVSYLIISLLTSLLMNLYNRSTRLVER
jgi:general L-amino acid transport system permease protein